MMRSRKLSSGAPKIPRPRLLSRCVAVWSALASQLAETAEKGASESPQEGRRAEA